MNLLPAKCVMLKNALKQFVEKNQPAEAKGKTWQSFVEVLLKKMQEQKQSFMDASSAYLHWKWRKDEGQGALQPNPQTNPQANPQTNPQPNTHPSSMMRSANDFDDSEEDEDQDQEGENQEGIVKADLFPIVSDEQLYPVNDPMKGVMIYLAQLIKDDMDARK